MYLSIRHLTRFRYSKPISESTMEVRMQPRSERGQRCLEFQLTTVPRARVLDYRDHLQNHVHHFNVPRKHPKLTITAEALVETSPLPELPEALPEAAWDELNVAQDSQELLDALLPSTFARSSPLLGDFRAQHNMTRLADPLTTVRHVNETIYNAFTYVPQSTLVDSPIDDALTSLRGVCQDFAHIMITLVRDLGIPCRYVSGYLYHRHEDQDRSEEDATHAWVEVWLPTLGWVGFDPTNNLLVGERHIRTAVGRDYADVPPSRGVYRGEAASELDVGVRVALSEAPIPNDEELLPTVFWDPPDPDETRQGSQQQQQQQQQQ